MTSSSPSTPPAEVEITPVLIKSLLNAQHPDLAGLSLKIKEAGWDNVMVRLGDDLALRLPRRAAAEPLILNEQTWLSRLAPHLPLPIPVPLRTGGPSKDYPFHWSIQKWLPGNAADIAPPNSDQAGIFADFLSALHGLPLPDFAPQNPVRDCPLSAKAADIQTRMDILRRETDLITPEIEHAWAEALTAKQDAKHCLIAGDIHPRNVLTHNGALSAIIDWGDMCAGDPATDFMGVWGLFEDPDARQAVFGRYGASEETYIRAKGWGIFSGVILAQTGRIDTPRHGRMGKKILRRITQDGEAI